MSGSKGARNGPQDSQPVTIRDRVAAKLANNVPELSIYEQFDVNEEFVRLVRVYLELVNTNQNKAADKLARRLSKPNKFRYSG